MLDLRRMISKEEYNSLEDIKYELERIFDIYFIEKILLCHFKR